MIIDSLDISMTSTMVRHFFDHEACFVMSEVHTLEVYQEVFYPVSHHN